MNEETLKILFSGPALALLLYENSRSKQDQEGFLLGNVDEIRTQTMTDAHGEKTKIERFIRVNSIVPCPNLMYFYDHSGRVDYVKLKSFLGTSHSKVVSWFKYKHTSQSALLFREKLVHKQLIQLFYASANTFSCCLLKDNHSENVSTYNYHQQVLCYHDNRYKTIPIHIENLSDLNDKYLKPLEQTPEFKTFLSSLKLNLTKTPDSDIALKIQKGLQTRINNSMKLLTKSEIDLGVAEDEVIELRKRLNTHRLFLQKHREQEIKRANDSVQVVQDLINLTDDSSDREHSSPELNSEHVNLNSVVSLTVIQNNLGPNVTLTRSKRNKVKDNNINNDTGRTLRKTNNALQAQSSKNNN